MRTSMIMCNRRPVKEAATTVTSCCNVVGGPERRRQCAQKNFMSVSDYQSGRAVMRLQTSKFTDGIISSFHCIITYFQSRLLVHADKTMKYGIVVHHSM